MENKFPLLNAAIEGVRVGEFGQMCGAVVNDIQELLVGFRDAMLLIY